MLSLMMVVVVMVVTVVFVVVAVQGVLVILLVWSWKFGDECCGSGDSNSCNCRSESLTKNASV